MKIDLLQADGVTIAEVISEEVIMKTPHDALELIANCGYQGAEKIIVYEKNVTPDFFDLKTGIAGEMLQKFVNYRAQLALIGDYSKFSSKSLKDFIYESNKQRRINFVSSRGEAIEKLKS